MWEGPETLIMTPCGKVEPVHIHPSTLEVINCPAKLTNLRIFCQSLMNSSLELHRDTKTVNKTRVCPCWGTLVMHLQEVRLHPGKDRQKDQ